MMLGLCFYVYCQYILGTHSEIHQYFLNEQENILFSVVSPYPKWMCFSRTDRFPLPEDPLLRNSCWPSLVLQSLPTQLQSHSFPFCWKFLIIHHLPSFQIQQKYTSSVIYNTTLLIWFLLSFPSSSACLAGVFWQVLTCHCLVFASTARMSSKWQKKVCVIYFSVSPESACGSVSLGIQSVM